MDIQERLARGIANGLSLSSDDEPEEDDEDDEEDLDLEETKVLRRRSGIEFVPCRSSLSSQSSLPGKASFRKLSDGCFSGELLGSDSVLIIKEKPPLPHKELKKKKRGRLFWKIKQAIGQRGTKKSDKRATEEKKDTAHNAEEDGARVVICE